MDAAHEWCEMDQCIAVAPIRFVCRECRCALHAPGSEFQSLAKRHYRGDSVYLLRSFIRVRQAFCLDRLFRASVWFSGRLEKIPQELPREIPVVYIRNSLRLWDRRGRGP